MHKEKFVFAQLAEFPNGDKFRHIVDKYNGNNYVKSFTCWNQLLVLMFGQLRKRESLMAFGKRTSAPLPSRPTPMDKTTMERIRGIHCSGCAPDRWALTTCTKGP